MKNLLYSSFVFVVISSCSLNLNNRIYDAQELAFEETPYYQPINQYKCIELQRQYRENYMPGEMNALINYKTPTDTLVIVETYDDLVIGPAEHMKVLYMDTIYSWDCYKDAIVQKTYFNPNSTDKEYLNGISQFLLVTLKSNSGKSWNAEPLKYGAKECSDGSHTVITVVTPDIKIESMYVRCWLADGVVRMLKRNS